MKHLVDWSYQRAFLIYLLEYSWKLKDVLFILKAPFIVWWEINESSDF